MKGNLLIPVTVLFGLCLLPGCPGASKESKGASAVKHDSTTKSVPSVKEKEAFLTDPNDPNVFEETTFDPNS